MLSSATSSYPLIQAVVLLAAALAAASVSMRGRCSAVLLLASSFDGKRCSDRTFRISA